MLPHDSLLQSQQLLIRQLSGAEALPTGETLPARCLQEERARARNFLAGKLRELGMEPETQPYQWPNINPLVDLLFAPFAGANVYGILPATVATDSYIVMGAHFDTERYCPGALDNGSGISLTYETARALAQLPLRRHHVILVYFDQEEEELIGSQAFAQWLRERGFRVHSVHTVDSIGWDEDGDGAIELELPDLELLPIYRLHAAALGIPLQVTRVNSTDHHSFRQLGFRATGLTDEFAYGDYSPYKDSPQDTWETVNYAYLARCTAFFTAVMITLCQS